MNDELERADLLRHFAHDLKNPLTAVRVLIEMLIEDFEGQAQEDLCDVVEAVDLCTAMAEGLSDLARVEAGAEPTYEIEASDLRTVVEQACGRASMRRHVELAPGEPVMGRVDPDAALRALSAVLLNAHRMRPTGPIGVELTPEAVVVVTQVGLRLDPMDAADLVRRYGGTRLRDRRVRASALGLAYARVTMEWLGGSLEVSPDDDALRVRLRFLKL